MSAAAAPRTLLGTLMCRAGLISEAQLEHALAVQGESGRPLGEVIVRLGYASPGAVANALAEQHRETLPTEYGVSTGLDDALRAQPPASARTDAERLAGLEERARAAEAQVERLEARLAGAEQAAAASVSEGHQLRADISDLERKLATASEAAAAAERRASELEEALAATREPEPPSEDAHLLFVPSPAGYTLARGEGPCPEPGARVELAGRAYAVARIGPSPLGDRLRCAYLEPTT